MKHGDFTELAKFYENRPGYSKVVLECLKNHIFNCIGEGKVADIGAGTGKLTENLTEIGLSGYAVEPNAAMRSQAALKNWGGGVNGDRNPIIQKTGKQEGVYRGLREQRKLQGLKTAVLTGY